MMALDRFFSMTDGANVWRYHPQTLKPSATRSKSAHKKWIYSVMLMTNLWATVLQLTVQWCDTFHSSLYSPLYYIAFLVITQIRGHIAGSSPFSPQRSFALFFYRHNTSALFPLLDSHRTAPTQGYYWRSLQLLLVGSSVLRFFFFKYSKKFYTPR